MIKGKIFRSTFSGFQNLSNSYHHVQDYSLMIIQKLSNHPLHVNIIDPIPRYKLRWILLMILENHHHLELESNTHQTSTLTPNEDAVYPLESFIQIYLTNKY